MTRALLSRVGSWLARALWLCSVAFTAATWAAALRWPRDFERAFMALPPWLRGLVGLGWGLVWFIPFWRDTMREQRRIARKMAALDREQLARDQRLQQLAIAAAEEHAAQRRRSTRGEP